MHFIFRNLRCILTLSCAILLSFQLDAKVSQIEIISREVFADGHKFGDTGAYEKIKGKLVYTIDPSHPANAAIVDLNLAPTNDVGLVEFSGDFLLLKPIDLEKGNNRLLYGVNNRGNLTMISFLNSAGRSNNPTTIEDAGNGFLMRQGYSLLWSAWNWDVRPGNDRLQIELPVITENYKPITQKIAAEIVVGEFAQSQPLAFGNSRSYPAVNSKNPTKAVLTVRDSPQGQRTEIPREEWSFARVEEDQFLLDPTHLYIQSGFEPGKIYELIYEAKDPRVVGLGLAAARDAISFFRFDTKDDQGNLNPLVNTKASDLSRPDPDQAYIFGISQSGRFITHTIFQGFHVDENNRMVFDGARIHVPGGGKGAFNFRFAQTTHHPSHLEGNTMPADFFPFNYAPQRDPVSNQSGDVLAVAKRMGKIPRILITNNELEYWTRSASLIHTDVTATRDAAVHENVRIYMTNGAPHGPARSRKPGIYEHENNPLSSAPVARALLVALDRWVSDGVSPPASRHPRLDQGELLTPAEHRDLFPKIPGMRHPGKNLRPPRLDLGEDFWKKGIMTRVPPKMGIPFETRVPGFDADGNGVGGIRLPELTVPLGTYQGWNPRNRSAGSSEFLARFAGSFWFLPRTKNQRLSVGDPRPSIEERYTSKTDYVAQVNDAVEKLIGDGFLLEEDAERYNMAAEKITWPPEPLNEPPFWCMAN